MLAENQLRADPSSGFATPAAPSQKCFTSDSAAAPRPQFRTSRRSWDHGPCPGLVWEHAYPEKRMHTLNACLPCIFLFATSADSSDEVKVTSGCPAGLRFLSSGFTGLSWASFAQYDLARFGAWLCVASEGCFGGQSIGDGKLHTMMSNLYACQHRIHGLLRDGLTLSLLTRFKRHQKLGSVI